MYNILIWCMRIGQNLDFFLFLFLLALSDFSFFFCLFLSFLFALLFSLSSTTHILSVSVACKKLDVNNG